MNDTPFDRNLNDTTDEHLPASEVAGAHDSDGTLGRVSGTGSGAIAGGIVGAAVAGPVGAIVGAVAGGALGAAAGDAAHHVGDDHDDVNVETGSDGELGRYSGSGAGGVSGAIIGGVAGGPVGAVVGGVAGGMLGAEAGDAAKDMGGATGDPVTDAPLYDRDNPRFGDNTTLADDTTYSGSTGVVDTGMVAPASTGATTGLTGMNFPVTVPADNNDTNYPNTTGALDNRDYDADLDLPVESSNQDTRGTMERLADAATGDLIDDNTGHVVTDSTGRPLTGNAADYSLDNERNDNTPRSF